MHEIFTQCISMYNKNSPKVKLQFRAQEPHKKMNTSMQKKERETDANLWAKQVKYKTHLLELKLRHSGKNLTRLLTK
jgi:hypothetical protein